MSAAQTVLVTGSGGFLGQAVTWHLMADGFRVIGFDKAPPEGDAGYPLVIGDVEDAHRVHAALREHRPAQILHMGALSGPMLARDNPHLMVRVNIHGTANVLEAARVVGVERIVFLSSIMAYGAQPESAPVIETAPLNAADAYGASKVAGEALMRAYAREHGLDTVSLRVASAYGPGRRTDCVLRLMIENALAGKATRLDYGKGCYRQYVHVDDVADAVVRAVARPRLPRPAYNVATGRRMTLDEVAAAVTRALPETGIELGSRPHPLDYPIGPLDVTAAREDLGYAPAVSLDAGVRAYADWMKGHA